MWQIPKEKLTYGLRKRKADGTIVEKTAVCLTCNTVVKTSGCTTNMMTNIRRVHPQLLSSCTTVQATTDPTIEAGPSERRQQTRQKQQTLQGVLAAQEKNTATTIFCFCLYVDMFLMLLAVTFIMKKGI